MTFTRLPHRTPLSALISDIYPNVIQQQPHREEPLFASRHGNTRHIYTVDISGQVERFAAYHALYAMDGIPQALVDEYIGSLVENMVAHFENQHVAVMSFVSHYLTLITQGVSPQYKYHPLRFIKQMDVDGYQHYSYCLYGFAEDLYNLFVAHGMFSADGRLLASYEGFNLGTLYLIVRPEVPDVFSY